MFDSRKHTVFTTCTQGNGREGERVRETERHRERGAK